MDNILKDLIGRVIEKIFIDDDRLVFETDKGQLVYGVDGDCCSHSYFHDFIGVEKLLKNGVVKSIQNVDLKLDGKNKHDFDQVEVYGYQIITEHEEFGEMTSVFSFRNSSNGYYGGSIKKEEGEQDTRDMKELTNDWVND